MDFIGKRMDFIYIPNGNFYIYKQNDHTNAEFKNENDLLFLEYISEYKQWPNNFWLDSVDECLSEKLVENNRIEISSNGAFAFYFDLNANDGIDSKIFCGLGNLTSLMIFALSK